MWAKVYKQKTIMSQYLSKPGQVDDVSIQNIEEYRNVLIQNMFWKLPDAAIAASPKKKIRAILNDIDIQEILSLDNKIRIICLVELYNQVVAVLNAPESKVILNAVKGPDHDPKAEILSSVKKYIKVLANDQQVFEGFLTSVTDDLVVPGNESQGRTTERSVYNNGQRETHDSIDSEDVLSALSKTGRYKALLAEQNSDATVMPRDSHPIDVPYPAQVPVKYTVPYELRPNSPIPPLNLVDQEAGSEEENKVESENAVKKMFGEQFASTFEEKLLTVLRENGGSYMEAINEIARETHKSLMEDSNYAAFIEEKTAAHDIDTVLYGLYKNVLQTKGMNSLSWPEMAAKQLANLFTENKTGHEKIILLHKEDLRDTASDSSHVLIEHIDLMLKNESLEKPNKSNLWIAYFLMENKPDLYDVLWNRIYDVFNSEFDKVRSEHFLQIGQTKGEELDLEEEIPKTMPLPWSSPAISNLGYQYQAASQSENTLPSVSDSEEEDTPVTPRKRPIIPVPEETLIDPESSGILSHDGFLFAVSQSKGASAMKDMMAFHAQTKADKPAVSSDSVIVNGEHEKSGVADLLKVENEDTGRFEVYLNGKQIPNCLPAAGNPPEPQATPAPATKAPEVKKGLWEKLRGNKFVRSAVAAVSMSAALLTSGLIVKGHIDTDQQQECTVQTANNTPEANMSLLAAEDEKSTVHDNTLENEAEIEVDFDLDEYKQVFDLSKLPENDKELQKLAKEGVFTAKAGKDTLSRIKEIMGKNMTPKEMKAYRELENKYNIGEYASVLNTFRGKSDKEIGEILGNTKHELHHKLKRAMQRYGKDMNKWSWREVPKYADGKLVINDGKLVKGLYENLYAEEMAFFNKCETEFLGSGAYTSGPTTNLAYLANQPGTEIHASIENSTWILEIARLRGWVTDMPVSQTNPSIDAPMPGNDNVPINFVPQEKREAPETIHTNLIDTNQKINAVAELNTDAPKTGKTHLETMMEEVDSLDDGWTHVKGKTSFDNMLAEADKLNDGWEPKAKLNPFFADADALDDGWDIPEPKPVDVLAQTRASFDNWMQKIRDQKSSTKSTPKVANTSSALDEITRSSEDVDEGWV
jgi:hypothetical protein